MAEISTGSRLIAGSPRYALLSISVDATLERLTREIQQVPGAMQRVIPPALNAAARQTRTMLYQAFTQRFDLRRKSSIKDRLEHRPKATRTRWFTGVRIALTRFTVGSFRDVQQTPSGVTWSTGGGRLRGGFIPRAFLRSGLTQYRTEQRQETRMVFRRALRGEQGFQTEGVNRAGHRVRATRAGHIVQRYPLKVLRGPSLGRVFSDDRGFQGQMERGAEQLAAKTIQQQVERITAQVVR